MSDRSFVVIFAIMAYAVFAIFGGSGIYLRLKVKRFLRASLKTKGTIVSIERLTSMSSGMLYKTDHPVFCFLDAQGKEHRVRSSVGVPPDTHAIGDSVNVQYLFNSPQDATIDLKASVRMAKICFLAAGSSFAFATIILMYLK